MSSSSGERKFSYLDFCIEDQDGRSEIAVSELQAWVTGMLQQHMRDILNQVVVELNEHGHVLEVDEVGFGDISYVDRSRIRGEKRLRLSVDIVVSVGFETPNG